MELKQQGRQRQRKRQKSNRLILAKKKKLCTCVTLFCTCLRILRRRSTIPNFMRPLYGVSGHNTKFPQFPFSKLWYGHFGFNPRPQLFKSWIALSTFWTTGARKLANYIPQNKLNWIRSIKFETKMLLPWQRDVTRSRSKRGNIEVLSSAYYKSIKIQKPVSSSTQQEAFSLSILY